MRLSKINMKLSSRYVSISNSSWCCTLSSLIHLVGDSQIYWNFVLKSYFYPWLIPGNDYLKTFHQSGDICRTEGVQQASREWRVKVNDSHFWWVTWCPSQVTGGNQTGGVTHDTSHCLTSISDTDGQRSSINLSSSLSNKILDKNTKRNMLKIKTKIF